MTEQIEKTLLNKNLMKLCQLCSPNYSKDEILAEQIDWQAVWRLAVRHRVVPVMAGRIKKLDLVVPDDVANLIADEVLKNLLKGMRQAVELVNLTKLFGEHDIPFVVFKGIALLKVMGLELQHRHHGDIDVLLADDDDAWSVDECLRDIGYERVNPPETLNLNNTQQQVLLAQSKDFVYWHPQKKIQLEVHRRFCTNKYIFDAEPKKIHERRSIVKINSNDIPAMSPKDYLFYSLVHGSISRWFRLKWLSDILLISNNGRDYNSPLLYEEAKTLGIERMVMQGVGLANTLFAMPVTSQFKAHLSQNRCVNQLMLCSYSSLNSSESEQALELNIYKKAQALFNRHIKYEPFLRSDLAYKIQNLQGYLTAYTDWEVFPLPSQLFFLYYPLRPFLWLRRQL